MTTNLTVKKQVAVLRVLAATEAQGVRLEHTGGANRSTLILHPDHGTMAAIPHATFYALLQKGLITEGGPITTFRKFYILTAKGREDARIYWLRKSDECGALDMAIGRAWAALVGEGGAK